MLLFEVFLINTEGRRDRRIRSAAAPACPGPLVWSAHRESTDRNRQGTPWHSAARCPRADCPAPRRTRRCAHPPRRPGTLRGTSGPRAAQRAPAVEQRRLAARQLLRPASMLQPPVCANARNSSSASRRPSMTAPDHARASCRSGCSAASSLAFAASFNARSAASRPTVACSARTSASAACNAAPSRAVTPRASNGSSWPASDRQVRKLREERSGKQIPVHQPMIQEGQRQPFRIGFKPQRQLRQLHRQRIAIHAIQAIAPRPDAGRWRERGSATRRYRRPRSPGLADRPAMRGPDRAGPPPVPATLRRAPTTARGRLGAACSAAASAAVACVSQSRQAAYSASPRNRHASTRKCPLPVAGSTTLSDRMPAGLGSSSGLRAATAVAQRLPHQEAHEFMRRVVRTGRLAAEPHAQIEAARRRYPACEPRCRDRLSLRRRRRPHRR